MSTLTTPDFTDGRTHSCTIEYRHGIIWNYWIDSVLVIRTGVPVSRTEGR